jgi:dipeptidyl aminopeptidase/acylaminoacyl peptidase
VARRLVVPAAFAVVVVVPCASAAPAVRVRKIEYVAHGGVRLPAYVVLPAWYGPDRNPPLPLVISPPGRGVGGPQNVRLWGDLPAVGRFAVVSPDARGRRLRGYSWGYAGRIADLARMPRVVHRALPWLRIDTRRVYAFGGSMGGEEALLLLARRPTLLAGVAAFDSVIDLALQYRNWPRLRCDKGCLRRWVDPIGEGLQALARAEVGGTPRDNPAAYAARSPIRAALAIALSCVPLQLWWSTADRIVPGQRQQTGRLFRTLRRLNPQAPVSGFVGHWPHSREMRSDALLPLALARFGLVPRNLGRVPSQADGPGASHAVGVPRGREVTRLGAPSCSARSRGS